MKNYWARHRLLATVVLCIVSAVVAGLLFAFPYINQQASDYNSQSIYKNSEMDFIAPEPSYEQLTELSGSNGIEKAFPFFLTKTQVTVNGASRTTTVLLSDQFENVGITMYNDDRLIEKATGDLNNPIWVDWQFCYDTGAKVGDTVSFTMNGAAVEFSVAAIYETNTIYDGGAILAEISDEQVAGIKSNSKNNGYSGVYISADNYDTCRTYLTTDYRPLGRLKDRNSFDSDEQYQIHYDAIMSAGYANEITDFRAREMSVEAVGNNIMVWLGAILVAAIAVVFNIAMRKRGCEKAYFTKHCIPKGVDVKPYYGTAFIVEVLLQIVIWVGVLFVMLYTADTYIPMTAIDLKLLAIPVAIILAGIINLSTNRGMIKKIEEKARKKQEENK
jgi:hypothetical protein